MKANGDEQGRALVIGAGVSGLTTALCLRREGYGVTVVADRFAPDVVSVVAGALWEWPPAVCGSHQDLRSLERSKSWCMTGYETFNELAGDGRTGVFVRPSVFYFRHRVEENAKDFHKMSELRDRVDGFVHDAALIDANGISRDTGVVDAYSLLAPMVDTDTYMAWLLEQVRDAGCETVRRSIGGTLADHERALLAEFDADVIVNCSGLGARTLADDEMHPLRGALVRVLNDGRAMPRITRAHCVSHDPATGSQGMVFILPRGRDMLVLGGLVEMDEWDLDIGLDNYGPVRDMLRRCEEFMPVLRRAEIDVFEPVRAGLRPYRRQNVRVEIEPGTRIVHNYGHGGSGVTLSWGCAAEVVQLAGQALADPVRARRSPGRADGIVLPPGRTRAVVVGSSPYGDPPAAGTPAAA
jgi:D-amino-acid oxidase